MNDYETALLRFEKISRSHAEIKRQAQAIINWADNEWHAAWNGLREYESMPGVELPQYRRDYTAPCQAVAGMASREDCGCPSCLAVLAEEGAWTLADAAHEVERIARDRGSTP